jgi:hypothetical protein
VSGSTLANRSVSPSPLRAYIHARNHPRHCVHPCASTTQRRKVQTPPPLHSPSPLRPPLRAYILRLLSALTRSRGTRPERVACVVGDGHTQQQTVFGSALLCSAQLSCIEQGGVGSSQGSAVMCCPHGILLQTSPCQLRPTTPCTLSPSLRPAVTPPHQHALPLLRTFFAAATTAAFVSACSNSRVNCGSRLAANDSRCPSCSCSDAFDSSRDSWAP